MRELGGGGGTGEGDMKKRDQRMMKKNTNKRGQRRKRGDLPSHYP